MGSQIQLVSPRHNRATRSVCTVKTLNYRTNRIISFRINKPLSRRATAMTEPLEGGLCRRVAVSPRRRVAKAFSPSPKRRYNENAPPQ